MDSPSVVPGGFSLMREVPSEASGALPSPFKRSVPQISIPIARIEQDGSGRMYTTYQVEVDLGGHVWGLSKRYSDFEELYTHLRTTYTQEIPEDRWPTFPQKTYFSRLSEETIEARRLLLEDFLCESLSLKMFPAREDATLRTFLQLDEGIRLAIEAENRSATVAAIDASLAAGGADSVASVVSAASDMPPLVTDAAAVLGALGTDQMTTPEPEKELNLSFLLEESGEAEQSAMVGFYSLGGANTGGSLAVAGEPELWRAYSKSSAAGTPRISSTGRRDCAGCLPTAAAAAVCLAAVVLATLPAGRRQQCWQAAVPAGVLAAFG